MSYAYAQKKRTSTQTAAPTPGGGAMESGVPNSARLAALESGQISPTAADKGHRVDLPEAVRAKMESSFGMDFSAVKLYESETLGQTGAEAMAQGNEIAFAPGKLDVASQSGQAKLGHEFSHIASQARGEVHGNGFLYDGGLEARADREGAMAARGESVSVGDYGGAVAPLSNASAAPMAGPMQAKKKKKKKKNKALKMPVQPANPVTDEEWENLHAAGNAKNKGEIKSAYDTIAEKQSENVTDEQFDAVNEYIADSRPINGYLRGNVKMNKTEKNKQQKKVDLIDQAMEQNRLGADITAYRGVSDMGLAPILKNSGNKRLMKMVNKDGSINHELFAQNKDLLKGVEFTDKGFGSTSVNEGFAEKWRKGIISREASGSVTEEVFKKYRDTPTGQDIVNGMLKDANVKKFEDLNNTDQLYAKKQIRQMVEAENPALDDENSEKEDAIKEKLGSHLYEIHAPKGAKATMIDRMRKDEFGQKGNAGQQEMLVGRNARYKINDILPMLDEQGNAMKNQYRIIMELLNDEEEK